MRERVGRGLAVLWLGFVLGCPQNAPSPDREPAPVRLERAFEPGPHTRSLPEAEPGDWLAEHPEEGQTFDQFLSYDRNLLTPGRRTIYLQPIGRFDRTRAPALEELRTFTATFFQLPVVVLPAVPLSAFASREHGPHGFQLHAGSVLKRLEDRLRPDAYCILGVTMADLYPEEGWNFVFGMGAVTERTGVFSFARYSRIGPAELTKAERQLVLLRGFKVLSHEIGHMFGMLHCTAHHCGMNGANHLRETDRAPLAFCPVCLQKLHSSVGFGVLERDQSLRLLLEKAELQEQAAQYRARENWVRSPGN